MMAVFSEITGVAAECNALLDRLLPDADPDTSPVTQAMRYSLLAGGKRIRPFLTVSFAALCGGEYPLALRFGCALEMIHTYSLIHDDLPAMDNDDLRRGMPTCHRKFGEATAILAGDALQSLAFSVITESEADDRTVRAALALLARASGHTGMVGGQVMDMASEGGMLPAEKLDKIQNLKTGALIDAACKLGCIVSGTYDGTIYEAAGKYAAKLGRAFQVEDDLLDATGDVALLGKPIGSDGKNGKVTYYTLLGEDGARRYAGQLTEEACGALAGIPGNGKLIELARTLLNRKN